MHATGDPKYSVESYKSKLRIGYDMQIIEIRKAWQNYNLCNFFLIINTVCDV